MKAINAYLFFNGECRQAMEFYKKCLGGELFLMKFSEVPPGTPVPPDASDRIMHAAIKTEHALLMASDLPPTKGYQPDEHFTLAIDCDSVEEVDRLFSTLGEGSKVTMPMGETFWAHRFVGFRDKFGVNWMLSKNKPMQM